MKAALIVAGALAASAVLAGCSFSPDDPEVKNEFYDNIEFLNRPPETADKGTRFRMARELFKRVDMESVKTVTQLKQMLGKPTAVKVNGNSQILEYDFESGYDTIKATYRAEGDKIVSAHAAVNAN